MINVIVEISAAIISSFINGFWVLASFVVIWHPIPPPHNRTHQDAVHYILLPLQALCEVVGNRNFTDPFPLHLPITGLHWFHKMVCILQITNLNQHRKSVHDSVVLSQTCLLMLYIAIQSYVYLHF